MKNVSLVAFTSNEYLEHAKPLNEISFAMEEYFKDKVYGDSLKAVIIGIQMYNDEVAAFMKIKKPKYTDKMRTETHDGISIQYERTLEYDLRITASELDAMKSGSDLKLSLRSKILNSLSVLDQLSKIKDFDKAGFKKDMEIFFEKLSK